MLDVSPDWWSARSSLEMPKTLLDKVLASLILLDLLWARPWTKAFRGLFTQLHCSTRLQEASFITGNDVWGLKIKQIEVIPRGWTDVKESQLVHWAVNAGLTLVLFCWGMSLGQGLKKGLSAGSMTSLNVMKQEPKKKVLFGRSQRYW